RHPVVAWFTWLRLQIRSKTRTVRASCGILSWRLRRVKILVTGSSGLIGSEAVRHFDANGHEVVGVDNNMRKVFFGEAGDTLWNLERLRGATKRFVHVALDIRDRAAIEELFGAYRFDLIVHCAA